MIRFLGIFIVFISVYHLLITFIGYGILGGQYLEQITIIKELIRGIALIAIALANFKLSKTYFKKRKKARLVFGLMLLYSVWISFIKSKSLYSMAIGIKYDFHFIFVFLSATRIWFILSKQRTKQNKKLNKTKASLSTPIQQNILQKSFPKIIFYGQYFLVLIIFIWFVLQILKFTDTKWFLKLWYGPVGDFIFWQNPPIYYRTGPWGSPRRQWIFAWPNNYWYFLVAFLPIALLWRKWKFQKIKDFIMFSPQKILNISIILFYLLAIWFTLSRTALVGTIVALALVNKSRIQKNKKIALSLLGLAILAIVWLSIWKSWSSIEHFNHKINWIQAIINQPLGHGLWTAGPAIYHGGTILPENYYLQVMADIGTIGFLIRAFLIFQFLQLFKQIQNYFKDKKKTHTNKTQELNNEINEAIFLHRKYLSIGRACLLIMWLFLHIFEDSMVNYLFFIPFGILTGYLSSLIRIEYRKN